MTKQNVVKNGRKTTEEPKDNLGNKRGCNLSENSQCSPQMVKTRSKRSLATVEAQSGNSKVAKRLKLTGKRATKLDQNSGDITPHQQNENQLSDPGESTNNNATISNPVVGSTKSLIDSIKRVKKGKLPTAKAAKTAVGTNPKEVIVAEIANKKPATKTKPLPKKSTEMQVSATQGHVSANSALQAGLDIQVTVNSSDDDYQEEDMDTQSTSVSGSEDSTSQSSSENSDGSYTSPSDLESDDDSSGFCHKVKDDQPSTSHQRSSSIVDELDELHHNPKFQCLLLEVLGDTHPQQHQRKGKGKSNSCKHKCKGKVDARINSKSRKSNENNLSPVVMNKIKSPSDTIVYAPVLARRTYESPQQNAPQPLIGLLSPHEFIIPERERERNQPCSS